MPIHEYRCDGCRLRMEVLDMPRVVSRGAGATPVPTPCECGGDWEEIFTSISFRLKGAGFHRNDYGPPADFKFATRGRIRMRQEIRDARDSGEIPKGQNPFNSSPVREPTVTMDERYGQGSEQKIGDAMKANHTKPQHDVDLGGGKAVRVTRTGKKNFVLGDVPAQEAIA